ncbi:MAG: YlbF family regulator [Verrucomicrobia bacterium]|nr:YlbF family regulator [Verrucomicrobiota bacterium]MCH8526257.1 YlbF family regulator [Kiritimatiellia bacterium]
MTQLLNEQDTPVIAKTRELCEALVAQDSYKAMKAKLDAFMNDTQAQSMYQELSDKQSMLVQKQESGSDLTEEEIRDFEDQRERLLLHPVAGGFVEAQQGFEELRDTVVRYVTKSFELGRVPTADEVKPQGGCCGGGCGGGCSC